MMCKEEFTPLTMMTVMTLIVKICWALVILQTLSKCFTSIALQFLYELCTCYFTDEETKVQID